MSKQEPKNNCSQCNKKCYGKLCKKCWNKNSLISYL